MVDLKLDRVTIRNWMKFRSVDLTFPEKGLVLVQGVNNASGGALLSVGSGKTGIGEAVSRTLLGVNGRFTSLKQFSSEKAGDTYVKVEATLLGKPLVVESGYKCKEMSKTGEALRYTYDSKKVERGTIQQTRSELSKLLGVSPLLAGWTAFIDGDSIKFNKLGQADSVELVMASLRQPPWNEYHEASKRFLGKYRRTLDQSETNHRVALDTEKQAAIALSTAKAAYTQERTNYEEAVRQNERMIKNIEKAVNTKKQSIQDAKAEIDRIAKQLRKMEQERADKSHALEISMHEIEEAIQQAEEARKPLDKARSAAGICLHEARTAYSNYVNAARMCPTCKRPMGQIDEARKVELAEAVEVAKAASEKAQAQWVKAEQTVVTLNTQYRDVAKKHRELSAKADVENYADQVEELEQGIAMATSEIRDYELEAARMQSGPSDSALKTAEVRYNDRKDALKQAKEKLATAAAALVDDQDTIKVLEYWNVAFSPYGIPNMVLRDAIAPLNKEARRISAAMTGGTIEVRYSTTRELASGLEKAQLNIEVDNKLGDKDLSGSSKGEAGLTNFIIAETLSEVGQVSRRVGYRWYDEIVPHQDPKVCHSIYSYMKEVAQRLGILVFLVDHNPVAANYADHVLLVEKVSESGSVYSSARWR